MSNVLQTAFEKVNECKWTFKDNHTIEVNDAFIFWTNFAGKPNSFGQSARTFNLAVPVDAVSELVNAGWRVREKEVDEEGNKVYFVNIKVNMASPYPPIVCLFSEYKGKKTKRSLDIESIGELDRIDIKTCDCLINCYESKKFSGKVTGYLSKLYVIQDPDSISDFDGKYDDWDSVDPQDAFQPVPEEDDNF